MQVTNNVPSAAKNLQSEANAIRIKVNGNLVHEMTESLRNEVSNCLVKECSTVYIDLKKVGEIELSGINEVIHSHYVLKNADKKMVLIYKKDSNIEKWIENTGIDKFIDTAIVH